MSERALRRPQTERIVYVTKSVLESRVTVDSNGCWLYRNNKNTYKLLRHGGELVKAHRHSFELYFGEIPRGFCVCHRCDVKALAEKFSVHPSTISAIINGVNWNG